MLELAAVPPKGMKHVPSTEYKRSKFDESKQAITALQIKNTPAFHLFHLVYSINIIILHVCEFFKAQSISYSLILGLI